MDWKSHIEVLLSAGATVEQLASGMGVTPNAVREIRAGRTRSPRADAAFKLADMKPDQFGESPLTHVTALFDTRMSKRALREKLGLSTDKQLAKLLKLPVEQVEGWADEDMVPALPQVMKLLGHPEQQEPAQPANEDPDADRIASIEVA
ncbi:TPA: helix-turn-helix transcriptional regulator [Stenotrophomonas maltophilia]|uniref:helix-turn-helix domain-containing protein n=1 Tax=Stenotrophomonas maltophilia TaxID=40324 RepID=UPI0009B2BECE|nr:helix-turn-helix transcriptional regulator [Stenotrophomonas maltophilia]MDH2061565.1 helix-turn-helix transcriptional regulator [Stenotrophomonas maltophilia]HDX0898640.1 helix-turn-helix transcriptional regulator [Stenotrophomonas maltophilia]HDX0916307.1 helix-turn-helix transcriptional regulator [Stenotrophomonas maltophilia]HEL3010232.1 helix-turn-helix transcriptional regulator [Stenotrophomonas maltophilia]HEL4138122.1 helix-turn-helix transcriptional regulator [Stenotrophomonas malt